MKNGIRINYDERFMAAKNTELSTALKLNGKKINQKLTEKKIKNKTQAFRIKKHIQLFHMVCWPLTSYYSRMFR